MSVTLPDHTPQDNNACLHLAAIVTSAADAIISETLDGKIATWNKAAEQLFGYTADEILGQPLHILAPPERWEEVDALLERARAGETIQALEAVRRHKDGSLIDISTTIFPVYDDAGTLIAISAIARDISARKIAEAAIATQQARFRSLIDKATDMITILSPEGVMLYQSPPINRILGWDPEMLVGRNAFEFVHPDDHAPTWGMFEAAILDPNFVPMVEFRFRHRDGSWRWLEATGTNLLADPNVAGFVVNSRDITDRKNLMQQLHEALEVAEAGMRAKGQFLAIMSHELRTPLQAIQGYAEYLLADTGNSLTPEQQEDLSIIHRSAGRMTRLIGDLLDLSRMEAGRLQLAHEPLDLAEILEQVRQDVAPQAAAKGLALNTEMPEHLPLLHGDSSRVRQILLNLVGNAVKFTDHGMVRIHIRCDDGMAAIAVEDTGLGIAPEVLPQLFEEFRQGDGRLSRRGGGAGLGLAISRQLAELMGGTIAVESTMGVGSTFTLHLPLTREAPAS
jgi:PAS domain S-box-containing protein